MIVDADRHACSGIATLLHGLPGYECLGTYAETPEAHHGLGEVGLATLAVAEIRELPVLLAAAKRAFPAAKLLVAGRDCSVLHAEAALRCGASGYIAKTDPLTTWHAAVLGLRTAAHWLCPEIAHLVLARRARPPSSYTLAPREREVLALLGSGLASRSIAAQLAIAPKTVESLRTRICAKLAVSTAAELADAAELQAALTPAPPDLAPCLTPMPAPA